MPGADYNYKRRIKRLLKRFDMEPKNMEIYLKAFTHTSAVRRTSESYELLEFLGDSIILVHVVSMLVQLYPASRVGLLSKAKSQIVSGETLSNIAFDLKLDKYIRIDPSISKSGKNISPGIMADILEAFVGAIYIDLGFMKVKKFLDKILKDAINLDLQKRTSSDYKSILQEEIQRRYKRIPSYELYKSTGPDHDKTFYVRVSFNNISMGKGKGKSKKEAEQIAASKTLERMSYYFRKIDRLFEKD